MCAYGLAENVVFVSSQWGDICELDGRVSCGLVRTAGHGIEIRIVDALTGLEVADGMEGEIWIHSQSTCMGYWNRPEISEKVFGASLGGDSTGRTFLRTGRAFDVNNSSRRTFCRSCKLETQQEMKNEAHLMDSGTNAFYRRRSVFCEPQTVFRSSSETFECSSTRSLSFKFDRMSEQIRCATVEGRFALFFKLLFYRWNLGLCSMLDRGLILLTRWSLS